MTRFALLLLIALTGCSQPFQADLFGNFVGGAGGGSAGAGGQGSGGSAVTGGNAGAGIGGHGAAGAPDGTGGATGSAGAAASTGGAPATGGATSTGGAATGGSTTGTPVDVVPGVQTDCVFPSRIDLPPLAPDACAQIQFGSTCMGYVGDGVLPVTLSNLVWDYSTLTLSMDITVTGTYAIDQGACGSESACHYKIAWSGSATTTSSKVVFTKTDRGYVGVSSTPPNIITSTSEICSTDTSYLNRVATCIRGGWTDYWYNLTVPCAQ